MTGREKTATLKLQPWLSAKCRVVDDEGQPVAGGALRLNPGRGPSDEEPGGFLDKRLGMDLQTGKDGTIELEGLGPESTYTFLRRSNGQWWIHTLKADWKPDSVKDLGDIKPRP